MKIYFMKQKALDSLQAEVADNLNKYQSSSFWMDEHFINQNMPKYYFDTGIEVADYQLISGGPETDFQNAKIVFEAFKNKLNPVQASDLRLWAYLAHVQHPLVFPPYYQIKYLYILPNTVNTSISCISSAASDFLLISSLSINAISPYGKAPNASVPFGISSS